MKGISLTLAKFYSTTCTVEGVGGIRNREAKNFNEKRRIFRYNLRKGSEMSAEGKRRFRSVIEEAIAAKSGIAEITAKTIRSDAAAILESVMGEFDEELILRAMKSQGFEAEAYRSTIRALAAVAIERRPLRNAVLKAR